jgi:hypothetical protein
MWENGSFGEIVSSPAFTFFGKKVPLERNKTEVNSTRALEVSPQKPLRLSSAKTRETSTQQ